MYRRISAVGLLALLSVFAVPAVAQASGYSDGGDGDAVIVADHCSTATMSFSGFLPGESTYASAPDAVTLASIKAVSSETKQASAEGTVDYSLASKQAGTYTITVTSDTNIAVATFTVTPGSVESCSGNGGSTSNADSALPNTGLETPTLIIWGASGALILGVALVFVLNLVRRNKKTS